MFSQMSFANSDLCSVWIYFSIEKIRSLSALLFGRTRHARVNLDKLGYLGYLGNNSFISHISPQKVATSEKEKGKTAWIDYNNELKK
jgi:hypothetical protein